MNSKITIQKMFVSWQFPTWELPVSPKGTTSSPQGNYQFPAWELLRTLCLLCLMVLAGAVEAQTYKYYAIHNKDKGYLKQYKGIVGNDGTFRFGNGYDDNGVTYWVYSSDGYLRNNMYYLNAVDSSLGATLYLSVTADTKWDLVDDGGKKRFQLQGTTKILGLDNTTPVLRDNAELSLKYTACEMTIGNETSWNGPHLASDNATTLTVGSPQLYTYLRAYYKQKVDYSFTNDNDDASKNKVSATGQERRVYAMLTAPASTDATRGDKWDFDTDAGVIYNNTTSNVTATATYLVTPIDPIALKIHQEKIGDTSYKGENKEFKLTVQPKAFTPAEGKNYLLFFVNDGNRRFPYDKAEYSGNSVLMSNGKKAQLADPATPNQEISWEIVPDAEGYYSFKNVSTGRYIFYDDKDYTISNYGVTKVGATELPDNDTRYKFRLYRSDHGTYNPSYHIIPYCYQFAVHTNSGMVQEIFCALNPNQSPQSIVNAVSLYKANGQDNTRYAFYAYESASKYCLKTDYSIGIPDAIKTGNTATITSTGNYNFTAQSYHWRNINGAPGNNNIELEIAGTGSRKDIVYTWEVTGDVANYLESTTFEQTNVDKSTFKINVLSLPEGAVTGTLKVTAKVTSPETLTAPIEITLNIDPPINNEEPTDFTEITSLSEITNPTGHYRLTADASGTPAVSEFKGFLDGGMHTVSGLSKSLFTTLSGSAVVRNLMLSVNTFSDSGPQGALAGQAIGSCRIYNVGVLAGSIGSTDGYCGGIVGFLGGSSRVINCFSYANITGGTYVGGIVGYNNYSTTSSDPKTMVMNCMFYGDITNGGNKAPIYNGKIITNRGDQNGVGNYNYFYGGASYVQDRDIQTYNCALMAETRFLQRFEFFRHLLNSHRELAAWWATGSTANKDQMMKWVLLPSQIGTSTPYPILKTPGYYPSVVNIDAENAPTT
ncbi:MAG: hypothetical protein IJV44_07970, partial [Prevotella sp.]|nr:hypothetical protein [Prevotella sp.]